ncbi:MAG: site-2 protease family protein, partial [Planctomycetota bacterium]
GGNTHMYLGITESSFNLLEYLSQIWLWCQVVLGIGLIIFIHELGHFLAAKKVGVRVETFSLGFGPRIFGFTRGGTDYRLSIIPLGGYVKMAGENPDDEVTGSQDELCNRSALDRMFIFSAGVIMNFIFAFITIPFIFSVGVPFMVPEIGQVAPGGPAWKAGLRTGDLILEVNDNTVYEFTDILLNVALGNKDKNTILAERDGKTFTVEVIPERNEAEGRYQIQVTAASRYKVVVDRESSAYMAGLRDNDRILSVNGIPIQDWHGPQTGMERRPLTLEIERDTDGGEQTLHQICFTPDEVVLDDQFLIGIRARINLVKGLRGSLAKDKDGFREGDYIWSVNGVPVLSQADLNRVLDSSPEDGFSFDIQREGKHETLFMESSWKDSLKQDLALVQNTMINSVAFMPDGAVSKLNDSDVVQGMKILAVNGKPTETYYDIAEAIQNTAPEPCALTISTPDKGSGVLNQKTITVKPEAYRTMDEGFRTLPALQIRKLSIFQAIKAGFHQSVYMVKTCYLTLSRIFTGDVGAKNLGGIITISRASYSFAELGLARLFFFLAILSINLGFLNVLPIPILDGGHLLFLLIEKIKGSPVNEKIMGYSQIVGLVLILALLIYVTYNDVLRLFS